MKIFLNSDNSVHIEYDVQPGKIFKDTSHPINEELMLADIRVGFELEFYLLGDDPNHEIDYLLKVGLASFAERVSFLPEGIEFSKQRDSWYIERDPTLDETPFGFELVSPVLNLNDFLHYFELATDLIGYLGKTTDKCGVHIHLSSKNLSEIDLKKALLFAMESKTLERWKNRSNYAKDIFEVFKNSDTSEFDQYLAEMSPFYSIRNFKGNHIELRCFGGENYEKKENRDAISDAFFSFLDAYKKGCDPKDSVLAYQSLLAQKEEESKKEKAISVNEVRRLYVEIANTYGYDTDVAIEMAIQLLEETRIVRRDYIEDQLSGEYYQNAKR